MKYTDLPARFRVNMVWIMLGCALLLLIVSIKGIYDEDHAVQKGLRGVVMSKSLDSRGSRTIDIDVQGSSIRMTDGIMSQSLHVGDTLSVDLNTFNEVVYWTKKIK